MKNQEIVMSLGVAVSYGCYSTVTKTLARKPEKSTFLELSKSTKALQQS